MSPVSESPGSCGQHRLLPSAPHCQLPTIHHSQLACANYSAESNLGREVGCEGACRLRLLRAAECLQGATAGNIHVFWTSDAVQIQMAGSLSGWLLAIAPWGPLGVD